MAEGEITRGGKVIGYITPGGEQRSGPPPSSSSTPSVPSASGGGGGEAAPSPQTTAQAVTGDLTADERQRIAASLGKTGLTPSEIQYYSEQRGAAAQTAQQEYARRQPSQEALRTREELIRRGELIPAQPQEILVSSGFFHKASQVTEPFSSRVQLVSEPIASAVTTKGEPAVLQMTMDTQPQLPKEEVHYFPPAQRLAGLLTGGPVGYVESQKGLATLQVSEGLFSDVITPRVPRGAIITSELAQDIAARQKESRRQTIISASVMGASFGLSEIIPTGAIRLPSIRTAKTPPIASVYAPAIKVRPAGESSYVSGKLLAQLGKQEFLVGFIGKIRKPDILPMSQAFKVVPSQQFTGVVAVKDIKTGATQVSKAFSEIYFRPENQMQAIFKTRFETNIPSRKLTALQFTKGASIAEPLGETGTAFALRGLGVPRVKFAGVEYVKDTFAPKTFSVSGISRQGTAAERQALQLTQISAALGQAVAKNLQTQKVSFRVTKLPSMKFPAMPATQTITQEKTIQRVVPAFRVAELSRTQTATSPTQLQRFAPTFMQPDVSILKTMQIQLPRTTEQTLPRTIETPAFPSPSPTGFPVPAFPPFMSGFFPGLDLPSFGFGDEGAGRRRRIRARQPRAFVPSFSAFVFGIKTSMKVPKASRVYSGFELRPIPKSWSWAKLRF